MAINHDGFPHINDTTETLDVQDWWGSSMQIQDRSQFDSEVEIDGTPDDVIGRIDDVHLTAPEAQRIIEVLQYMINKQRMK